VKLKKFFFCTNSFNYERNDLMNISRNAAIDVGDDCVKALFGKEDHELYMPNVIARDTVDRPVIGIEE
jgi:plasmid segregation protein ParM